MVKLMLQQIQSSLTAALIDVAVSVTRMPVSCAEPDLSGIYRLDFLHGLSIVGTRIAAPAQTSSETCKSTLVKTCAKCVNPPTGKICCYYHHVEVC